MPALVFQIILDEEPKGDRRILAHGALGLELIVGDVVHDCHQDLVLSFPPGKQRHPGLRRVAVGVYPTILIVPWSSVVTVERGAHKTLADAGVIASLRGDRQGRNYIRLSPHFYNTDEELRRALELL